MAMTQHGGDGKQWLTTKEAMQVTGLSRVALYNLKSQGVIDTTKDGGFNLYNAESLYKYCKTEPRKFGRRRAKWNKRVYGSLKN